MTRSAGALLLLSGSLCFAGLSQAAPSPKPAKSPSPTISFERDVRSVLKTYCFDCHGAGEKLEGNLDLRLKRFLLKGGNTGPGITPGKPETSKIIQRMKSGQMPPVGKKVPPELIATVEKWIAAGAPALREEPKQLPLGFDITPDERAYWFYQPVRKPTPPAFKPADRVRTPIDAFILRRLREKKLSFNPDADRLTLIKRATFDLTGLPPTPQEVGAFVNDPCDDAYEKLIDRLLASPAYGERWGRHWLDVAGYADSDGDGSNDTPRQFAYKYRDYVIRSLNADKPFDQFITEQLAGDELVPRPWKDLPQEQLDKLIATGFLRTAVDAAGGGGDPAATNQVVGDTIKIVTSALLGTSVGCAQCHDHKYDPIPQSDYYRIRAILEPALNPANWRSPGQRLHSLYTDADRAKAAEINAEAGMMQQALNEKTNRYVETAFEAELLKFPEDQRAKLRTAIKTPEAQRTPEQKLMVANNPKLLISPGVLYQYNTKASDELKADQAKVDAVRAKIPPQDFVSLLTEEPGVVPTTKLFYRGDYRSPKQEITPGDLTIAAPEGARVEIPAKDPNLPTTGRRLAWAKLLTSGNHPLVGRVLVNRVWLNHFGRGMVDTPGEFGKLGTKPTHPELLDYLASTFTSPAAASGAVESGRVGERGNGSSPAPSHPDTLTPGLGWSLKALHRAIMLSTVYRQASTADAKRRAVDTDGSLYSRYSVRRLDAESIRDRILTAAGRLDRTQFGPAIPFEEDAYGQISAAGDSGRRSVYLVQRRTKPISLLVAFDGPIMTVNCERRITSNSAPQALMLMNSDFILRQAGKFALQVQEEAKKMGLDLPRQQIAAAWRTAYLRQPTAQETEAALKFLIKQQDLQRGAVGADKAELAALTSLCQQLLSSNEFLYVD